MFDVHLAQLFGHLDFLNYWDEAQSCAMSLVILVDVVNHYFLKPY